MILNNDICRVYMDFPKTGHICYNQLNYIHSKRGHVCGIASHLGSRRKESLVLFAHVSERDVRHERVIELCNGNTRQSLHS